MGILDFLLGRKSSSNELDEGVEKERKVYGNLYSGGAGRVNHDLQNLPEEKIEKNNPNLERRVSRLQDDLHNVERRARDLHVYNNPVRKKIGKVESFIGGVSSADNPQAMSVRNAKLRMGIKKSYGKIKEEHDRYLEKLHNDGVSDSRIREKELKLDKIRKSMSSMYRRSGGSGILK